jgi:hypothetical protein
VQGHAKRRRRASKPALPHNRGRDIIGRRGSETHDRTAARIPGTAARLRPYDRTQYRTDASDLTIVDPAGDDALTVGEGDLQSAIDPILRGSLARVLRSSGLPSTADVIAAPSGRESDAKPYFGPRGRRLEQSRVDFVQEKRGRARAELAERGGAISFRYEGTEHVGRVVRLDLPRPLLFDGTVYRRINIRQGIRREILTKLGGEALEDRPIMECAPWIREEFDGVKLVADGETARLLIGSLFFSELRLRR